MRELREVVSTRFREALNESGEVELPDLAGKIIRDDPDEVSRESEKLVYTAVLNMLKGIARSSADASGQLELWGFPQVIAVDNGEGYTYMKAVNATYGKLIIGCSIREENVERATAKLDAYREALDKVRPFMEGTQKTLAEVSKNITPTASA